MFWLIPLGLGLVATAAVLETAADDARASAEKKRRDAERDFQRLRQQLAGHQQRAHDIVHAQAQRDQQQLLQVQIAHDQDLLATEQASKTQLDSEVAAVERQLQQDGQTPNAESLKKLSAILKGSQAHSAQQQQALQEDIRQCSQRLQALETGARPSSLIDG